MQQKNIKIEEKSIATDVAAAVAAIGTAIPAGRIIGSTIRQVIDNQKQDGGNTDEKK